MHAQGSRSSLDVKNAKELHKNGLASLTLGGYIFAICITEANKTFVIRLVAGLSMFCGLLVILQMSMAHYDDSISATLVVFPLIFSCIVNVVVPLLVILRNENMLNFAKNKLSFWKKP